MIRLLLLKLRSGRLETLSLLELHRAALFNIMYFATARFKEVQALQMENVRVSAQGNLEIVLVKGKKNQTMEQQSSMLAPSCEAMHLCPVALIVQYRNALMRAGGIRYFFPLFTGARNMIPGSQISYNNTRSLFWKLLEELGLSKEEVDEYGLHSLRIGSATNLSQGVEELDL